MYNKVGILRYFGLIGLALAMTVAMASELAGTKDNETILSIVDQVRPADQKQLSLQDLQALPNYELNTSTVVTDGVMQFHGVLMRDLLDSLSAKGTIIEAGAANGYSIDIPWSDAQNFDMLVAWAVDGVLLDANDKGPLWIVYPRDQFRQLRDIRYDYRWVWQLNRLTIK